MERPRAVSEASSPRDAPAYNYAPFAGYHSSLAYYNQQASFDTQPISRDGRGGYVDHPSRAHQKEAPGIAGNDVSGSYSYTSSYDDLSRRYGHDGGSYLSDAYKGRTFDGTSGYYHESSYGPSVSPLTSGFSQDVGSRFGSREQAFADEQRGLDMCYGDVGSQKGYFDITSKPDGMSYGPSAASGRHDREYGLSYPPKDYNVYIEQSTSGYHGTSHDSVIGAVRDGKSSYLLASKYDTTPSGLYLSSSGASYDSRSSGGLQRAQEEFQWKGFSSLSSIEHEPASHDRAGSSSRYMDASAHLELRELDKLSAWNEGFARLAELGVGQKGNASSLMHTKPLANGSKMADTKEASLPMQGVSLQKSADEGKKRKTRWAPVEENEKTDGDGIKKPKRKSRWAAEKSPGKEVKLADATKETPVEGMDVVALRGQLLIINYKLQSGQVLDDQNDERSPSPEPILDNFGFRINTREHRAREKLNKERQRIMAKLSARLPSLKLAEVGKPSKLSKKIYIPVDKYPDYNFVGLIIGPRGHTQKEMEKESGAKIFIRGKGSVKEGVVSAHLLPSDNDSLHVLVEADSEDAINKASEMVEKLLVPVEDGQNELKRAQLRKLASINGTLRGNEVCHECKEPGHMSKECPLAAGSSVAVDQKGRVATGGDINLPKGGSMGGNSAALQVADLSTNDDIDNRLLYVAYLPLSVDDAELLNLFSPFGQIVLAKVMRHLVTGISKSYGFVKFDDAADAAQAMALMNGYQVNGKALLVKLKTKSEPAS